MGLQSCLTEREGAVRNRDAYGTPSHRKQRNTSFPPGGKVRPIAMGQHLPHKTGHKSVSVLST